MNNLVLTVMAMIAFAANSVLCRMVLEGREDINASSFELIRLGRWREFYC